MERNSWGSTYPVWPRSPPDTADLKRQGNHWQPIDHVNGTRRESRKVRLCSVWNTTSECTVTDTKKSKSKWFRQNNFPHLQKNSPAGTTYPSVAVESCHVTIDKQPSKQSGWELFFFGEHTSLCPAMLHLCRCNFKLMKLPSWTELTERGR